MEQLVTEALGAAAHGKRIVLTVESLQRAVWLSEELARGSYSHSGSAFSLSGRKVLLPSGGWVQVVIEGSHIPYEPAGEVWAAGSAAA